MVFDSWLRTRRKNSELLILRTASNAARNFPYQTYPAGSKHSSSTFHEAGSQLLAAATAGDADLVHRLLGANVDQDEPRPSEADSPLLAAVKGGHKNVVDHIIRSGRFHTDLAGADGRQALSHAAKEGRADMVALLLASRDIQVHARSHDRRTALSFAAESGRGEVVKMLLAVPGIDVCSPDSHGRTPLSYAAQGGHEETVRQVLAHCPENVDAADGQRYTPLHYATRNCGTGSAEGNRKYEAVVMSLLATGRVDPGRRDADDRTPLSHAAGMLNAAVVELLLHDECHPELDRADKEGKTAIWWAVKGCDKFGFLSKRRLYQPVRHPNPRPEQIKKRKERDEFYRSSVSAVLGLLLRHPCLAVNIGDNTNGETPLILAASSNCITAVEALLGRQDIDPNLKCRVGWTALDSTTDSKIRWALFNDERIHHMDPYRALGIFWQAMSGDEPGVVLIMLKKGMVDLDGSYGIPPDDAPKGYDTLSRAALAYAAKKRPRLLAALLDWEEHGKEFDPDATNKLGRTALSYAAEAGCTEAVAMLLSHKGSNLEVDPSRSDRRGGTALSYAAEGGHSEAVELLLGAQGGRRRIQPDDPHLRGGTLLSMTWAAYSGHRGRNEHRRVLMLLLADDRVMLDAKWPEVLTWFELYHETAFQRLLARKGVHPNQLLGDGHTPLQHAAGCGEAGALEVLLRHPHVEPDQPNRWGQTALFHAAGSDRGEEVISMLLSDGRVNPNHRDMYGRTAFFYAIEINEAGNVRRMLADPRIDLNATDRNDVSPLFLAISKLEHDDRGSGGIHLPNREWFLLRNFCGFPEDDYRCIIKLLLSQERVDLMPKQQDNIPLLWAVRKGDGDIRAILMARAKADGRVDANEKDGRGKSVLSYAAEMGQEQTVRHLLLLPNIDINLEDEFGRTALFYAASGRHTEMFNLLLSLGLSPSSEDLRRITGSYIVQDGHLEYLEAGVN